MEFYKRPGSPYWWASVPVPGWPRSKRFSTKRRDKKGLLMRVPHTGVELVRPCLDHPG